MSTSRPRSYKSRSKTEPFDVDIKTSDGVTLRARFIEPSNAKKSPGVVVLSHAMFARKSEFFRAGFADAFAAAGFGVCAFDFRGHGDSGTPQGSTSSGETSYDDMVARDLPEVVACARERTRGRVVVVGHSLGGHAAVASAALGLLDADAIIGIGANVWLRRFEPSLTRWTEKQLAGRSALAVVDRVKKFPARALRMGSDDASATMIRSIFRPVHTGAWTSDDGRIDYGEKLASAKLPLFALTSDGDTIMCHPECGARFARATSGTVEVYRIARSDDGGQAPGHMGMVVTSKTQRTPSFWTRCIEFAKRA
jgi:predicted alpha/beta hydrolase